MKYGDWELRDNSVHYNSQNIIMYPNSNTADEGSLHTETNVRSIVRRITTKSYKLNDSDFKISKLSDTRLKVSSGEANVQGYHVIVNSSIEVDVIPSSSKITPYTLGLSLSYDAANNVTGDVVNNTGDSTVNEVFSGAYLTFFTDC